MNPQPREVYVPTRLPDRGATGEDLGGAWPRPVFTPGEEGRERALAARVREALDAGPRRPGPDGAGHHVVDLFRSPAVARAVVGRLSREARDHGCTAIVATGPGGSAVGAPVAVDAGLPLVLGDGPDAGAGGWRAEAPAGGEGAGLPGAGDRVILVAAGADSGERLAAAADRVERDGARVAAVAVVVEVAGGDARGRLDDRNFMSICTL